MTFNRLHAEIAQEINLECFIFLTCLQQNGLLLMTDLQSMEHWKVDHLNVQGAVHHLVSKPSETIVMCHWFAFFYILL